MTGERQPNVLLVHCHDVGRFLGCYGIPTVRTPSLDTLAGDGVRFDQAFCTAPQCSPSRAALFTGRYPHDTGVMGLTHGRFAWDMAPGVRHLAALLGEAGYWTGLIGVHHESRERPDRELAARLGFDHVHTGGRAPVVAERAVQALSSRGNADRPFYLQVGFIEPHRIGPKTENGTRLGFIGDDIVPDAEFGVTIPAYLSDDDTTRREIAELQGAVGYMDAAVGQILAALEEQSLSDNTIVIFTTDHGLALPGAKCTLYDPGLETALIIRAPHLGWVGGQVEPGLVSNVDLAPTILDAVGLPIPSRVQGESLIDRPTGRARVFGEITYHSYYDPRRCIRTETHKLIVNFEAVPAHMAGVSQTWRPWSTPATPTTGLEGANSDPLELYDLRDDPFETHNLAANPEHQNVFDQLRHELLVWMRETGDPVLDGPVPSPFYDRARRAVVTGEPP